MRIKNTIQEVEVNGQTKFSINENLATFEKNELLQLIETLTDKHPEITLTTMDWLMKRSYDKVEIDTKQVKEALDESKM